MQEEVVREYKKIKQVIFFVLSHWGLYNRYSCINMLLFFTAHQLPRGEAALQVPAQQVSPHQAANIWFWPAQSPAVVHSL